MPVPGRNRPLGDDEKKNRETIIYRLKGSIHYSGGGEVAVSRETIEEAIRLLESDVIESSTETNHADERRLP